MIDPGARTAIHPACAPREGCITCSDEGIVVTLVAEPLDGLVTCIDEDGTATEADVSLVEPVGAGDRVLIHAGVALTRLDGVAA